MIAPAVISHYHHKAKKGFVPAAHHIVSHPMNAERVTLKRALILSFIMGVVWMPFWCWEQVRECYKDEDGPALPFILTMALITFGVSMFVSMRSKTMTLGGIVRRQADHSGVKPEKDSKAQ